ncbi:MAG: DUF1016 family protein [Chlamydiia bacterium]|nr:DUF1016 family protein [Chlamydiia bacterium]
MTLDTRQSDLASLQVDRLMSELRQMIDQTRESIATTVNAKLTMLYWQIGNRIYKEILNEDRAAYGKAIVVSVSQQLTTEYGKSFNEKNLRRMIQFAEIFSDPEIVVSLIRHLSWTHFIALIPIKDAIKRDFYAEMCRLERWNVKTLRKKIDSMLFERTALSKKPDSLIRAEVNSLREEDRLSPDLVFRDPYFLDFLKLNDRYFERDIEDAIMRELEQFLLEIGTGFCFLARQKRITVDNVDFYIDLLFFHRDLNRLVVIELKLGDFKPEHKGQLELYLRWLDKYERRPSELAPMGLLLCTGKNQEQIELLELGQAGIHVAEYLTVLPPKEVLKDELHKAVEQARKRLQADSEKEEEI